MMTLKDKFKILTYNIGFVNKSLGTVINDGIGPGDIHWMRHCYKDRYFADPFIIKMNDEFWYILCEELTFWEQKGTIVMLKVRKSNYELEERKMVIEEPYHLSFPFCKFDGEWVIPEASVSDKTYAYMIDRETFSVKRKELIAEEGLIDNVLYQDVDGDIWIYAGRKKIPSTELYVLTRDQNGLFRLASEEPILSDNRHARGAGTFFEYNNKLYRPVQDCKGRYGRQTKIMEILKIGKEGYQAIETCTLNSFANPPFDETMHTFNVYEDVIIIDGSKDFVRFPMKILYRKLPWLFKKIFASLYAL